VRGDREQSLVQFQRNLLESIYARDGVFQSIPLSKFERFLASKVGWDKAAYEKLRRSCFIASNFWDYETADVETKVNRENYLKLCFEANATDPVLTFTSSFKPTKILVTRIFEQTKILHRCFEEATLEFSDGRFLISLSTNLKSLNLLVNLNFHAALRKHSLLCTEMFFTDKDGRLAGDLQIANAFLDFGEEIPESEVDFVARAQVFLSYVISIANFVKQQP
jgi:hypothetical protein